MRGEVFFHNLSIPMKKREMTFAVIGIAAATAPLAFAQGDVIVNGTNLGRCVKYFDGCNTCYVKDDGRTVCTEMACIRAEGSEPAVPKCLAPIADPCGSVAPGTNGCGIPPIDWEAKKAEQLKKQAELRMDAVRRAKEMGVDVSGITAELLDPAKTSESEFWKAMELAKRAREAVGLKKKLEELRAQGYEITPDLEEYASSGNYAKFWPAVKALLEKGRPVPNGMCGDSTRCQGAPGMRDGENRPQPPRPAVTGSGIGMGIGAPSAARKPVLSEKTRKLLVSKLDAIPAEKRAAFYEAAKSLLESKIAKAREAKQVRTVAMLEEILKIITERVGPEAQDESSVIEELFNQ